MRDGRLGVLAWVFFCIIGLIVIASVRAEDGDIGATSTGKCNISITIPPRYSTTPVAGTPVVLPFQAEVEKKVLGNVIVYIYYPKVD